MSGRQSGSGYSIFHETMADMTFPELVQAAADRAVVLWGLGVIEQHGPHLPLGTDVPGASTA
jgi:creatinine amidohydrolase